MYHVADPDIEPIHAACPVCKTTLFIHGDARCDHSRGYDNKKTPTNSFKLKHQVHIELATFCCCIAFALSLGHESHIHSLFFFIRKEMALMLIVILYDRLWTVLCCFADSRKIDFPTKQRTMTFGQWTPHTFRLPRSDIQQNYLWKCSVWCGKERIKLPKVYIRKT